MQVLNKPECKKCGDPALTLVNGMWLCGKCLVELQNKINKIKEKLLLEEECSTD